MGSQRTKREALKTLTERNTMTDIELQEKLASIDKLQAETHKLVSDTIHLEKKNKWFEFTLVLALIAATVAVTKLFL